MSNRIIYDALIPRIRLYTGSDDINDYLDQIPDMAIDAENLIATNKFLKLQRCLAITVENYLAPLPDNCFRVENVNYACANVCSCGIVPCTCGFTGNLCFPYPYPFGWSNYGWFLNQQDWSHEGNAIRVPFRNGGIVIDWYCLPVDCNGKLLLMTEHLDAIAAYISYRISSAWYLGRKIDRAMHLDMKQRWQELCVIAASNDKNPSSQMIGQYALINNNPYRWKSLAYDGAYNTYW